MKSEITIKATDIDAVQDLLELLAENLSDLPLPVIEALSRLSDGEALVWDRQYFHNLGIPAYELEVFVDGVLESHVARIKPLSGTVEHKKFSQDSGHTICSVSRYSYNFV